jgi:hyperosmotically inducible periplasmic protein
MNKRPGFLLVSAAATLAAILVGGCSKQPEVAVSTPTTLAAGDNVADVEVTGHVKAALRQDESLKNADISVVTVKGDVRLTGVLQNQAQIDRAIGIARAADGAHSIHDELTLRK